jgi:carboxyl-terminal processing protease
VLSIDGIPTAGLSVEQVEQLSWLDAVSEQRVRNVRLLRSGQLEDREVSVQAPVEADAENQRLESERIPYAEGMVLSVNVPEVSDTLGEHLSEAIRAARSAGPLKGVVLDLRGNGGGSTDGAEAAIGVFLPGVPSFPLLLRGGEIEVEHALVPAQSSTWSGPVAVIVDGYTASAAEMIAGALGAYARGIVLGSRTFGKGCIQEYFDDRAGTGVLRLTTMLFALPDGSPLQGVGLTPAIRLPMPATPEREATLDAALPPWRGPDVRPGQSPNFAVWSRHAGRVGPCRDQTVCAALRRLGHSTRAITGVRAAKVTANALRQKPAR